MRFARRPHSRAQRGAGFTLIEMMIASTLFVGVGYVLLMSSRASERSHQTVSRNVESNDKLREVTARLQDELRSARSSTIELTQPFAGTATIEFQTAIDGFAGPAWGVFDRRLATHEDECSREGWTIQYAVEQGGLELNSLVRRVVDESGATHLVHTMVSNVVNFTVDATGDVWIIELETLGDEGRRKDEFDVRIRNQ